MQYVINSKNLKKNYIADIADLRQQRRTFMAAQLIENAL